MEGGRREGGRKGKGTVDSVFLPWITINKKAHPNSQRRFRREGGRGGKEGRRVALEVADRRIGAKKEKKESDTLLEASFLEPLIFVFTL